MLQPPSKVSASPLPYDFLQLSIISNVKNSLKFHIFEPQGWNCMKLSMCTPFDQGFFIGSKHTFIHHVLHEIYRVTTSKQTNKWTLAFLHRWQLWISLLYLSLWLWLLDLWLVYVVFDHKYLYYSLGNLTFGIIV